MDGVILVEIFLISILLYSLTKKKTNNSFQISKDVPDYMIIHCMMEVSFKYFPPAL